MAQAPVTGIHRSATLTSGWYADVSHGREAGPTVGTRRPGVAPHHR